MKWTKDEIAKLRELWLRKPVTEVVAELHRSIWSVRRKAHELELGSYVVRYDWVKIANEHKPRIVLAQPRPAERVR